MSESLVQIGNNQALQQGGVGLGANIFRARPALIELIQTTSRAENVTPGEFRVVSTNMHLGKVIRVVLLSVPQEQREWFKDKTSFTKENKRCFSLDNIQPHSRALEPPAMYCKSCPKGDLNWAKWRMTRDPNDLPSCNVYWNVLVADRKTQRPYFLNIKGKSYQPFRQAMEQQMSSLLADIFSNVRVVNKERGYTFVKSENRFVPIPGFVVAEGKSQLAPEPLPSIYNISFDIKSKKVNYATGTAFVMEFSDFKLMSPEDCAEFGNLYLEIVQSKIDTQAAVAEATITEAEAAEAVMEPSAEVKGEVIPPSTPITI